MICSNASHCMHLSLLVYKMVQKSLSFIFFFKQPQEVFV